MVTLSAPVLFRYEEELNEDIVASRDMKPPSARTFAALSRQRDITCYGSLAVILFGRGLPVIGGGNGNH